VKTIGDRGGDTLLLKAVAWLFQTLSTTKNIILFMVATKECSTAALTKPTSHRHRLPTVL
jgi:hypothetical protein